MNDSHEDLVRLAQEAKMYKDLARGLAAALNECHARMRWRGEGPNEGYERIAANFLQDTGLLAPGKDARYGPSYEERAEAFEQWFLRGSDAVVVALTKYRESLK